MDRRTTAAWRWLLLVAIAGLAACASRPLAPAHRPPSTPDRPGPAVPAYARDELGLGVGHAAGWVLSRTGLSITTDAGSTWLRERLPAGVRPAEIGPITVGAAAETWLTVPNGEGVDLYHRRGATAGRRATRLVPDTPPGTTFGGPPSATVVLGPAPMVIAVVGWQLTTAGAYERIFVSADGGAHFIQHPAPGGSPITAVTFRDRTHGLVIEGPTGAPHLVFRTADAGVTWPPVKLPVPPGASRADMLVGPPDADGSGMRLPVVFHSTRFVDVRLYVSRDDGRTFVPGPALVLPVDEDPGETFPAFDGSVAWLSAGRHVFRTTNGGRSWTPTPSPIRPASLGPASDLTALAVTVVNGCRGFKSRCYSYAYFVRTVDGARSWATTGPR